MTITPYAQRPGAPRCPAKAKRTGKRCRAPAVKGWRVCRVHGARGGAPRGKAHGMWKHGGRSYEVRAIRALTAALCRSGGWMI